MDVLAKTSPIGKTFGLTSAIAGFSLYIATYLAVSALSAQVFPTVGRDADLQQFVGTWHADFKGKTFETIVLKEQDGKLAGTVSRGEIQLKDNGDLTSAEQTEGNDPIIEATITAKILRITCKDEDGDTIQSEIRLTGDGEAELRMIAPPHVTAPKPWKLERAAATNRKGDRSKNPAN